MPTRTELAECKDALYNVLVSPRGSVGALKTVSLEEAYLAIGAALRGCAAYAYLVQQDTPPASRRRFLCCIRMLEHVLDAHTKKYREDL